MKVPQIEDLVTWNNKHGATSLISWSKMYLYNHFVSRHRCPSMLLPYIRQEKPSHHPTANPIT
jgi:hypothetical protein